MNTSKAPVNFYGPCNQVNIDPVPNVYISIAPVPNVYTSISSVTNVFQDKSESRLEEEEGDGRTTKEMQRWRGIVC